MAKGADVEITSFKGFKADLTCRDFKFEVGKSYEVSGEIIACENGFHACEHPLDVFSYYAPAESRFAIVKQSGQIARHKDDTKIASAKIFIEAEIRLPELIAKAIEYVFANAKKTERKHTTKKGGSAANLGPRGAASATGYSGAASATGPSGAASATGPRGAASATGPSGAAMSSGYCGRAMGADGCALFLVYRPLWDGPITHAWAGIAGKDGIKALTWYTLNDKGKPVEITS